MTCFTKSFSFYAGEDKDLEIALAIQTDDCRTLRRLDAMVRAALVVQALTYTAIPVSIDGNLITIAYTVGGVAGSEVVTVVGNAISVQIASGVSTATQIRTAVLAKAAAAALVTVAITGSGAATQVAAAAVTMAGGDGDKIVVTVPATPDDLVFDYNSSPVIEIVDLDWGQLKIQLSSTETDAMIDGSIKVEVTDNNGKKKIFYTVGGAKKLSPQGCD